MRQKEETHQQKCVFQSKNKKGQQYVVGIDKGYVVTTN
jgi:outer membrane protease